MNVSRPNSKERGKGENSFRLIEEKESNEKLNTTATEQNRKTNSKSEVLSVLLAKATELMINRSETRAILTAKSQ